MKQFHNSTLGINELISRIKSDLLAEQNQTQPDLFSIDEVTIELNFVVNGNIDSGFDIGVVTLGSQVSEERIQKITIKLTPLVTKDQLIERINSEPEKSQEIAEASGHLIRGL